MKHFALSFTALLVSCTAWAQTNLPDVEPGLFNASTRIEINAPIEKVWEVLLNFTDYPNWNPFARSQVVTDANFNPIADQTPTEGRYLIITCQIPPLTPPVNASTPSNPLHSQTSHENITHIQPDLYRAAWKQNWIPELLLSSERWSALSVVDGQTLYESREVYAGPLSLGVFLLYKKGLQESFDAQGVALKALLEG